MDKDQFISDFTVNGSVILEDAVPQDFIPACIKQLEIALEKERHYLSNQGLVSNGYVLANAKYGGLFWDVFNYESLILPLEWIMGANCITYSYTSSSMPPNKGNPSSEIHVDCPVFASNPTLRIGMLLALTDFTEENGATRYLAKSHKLLDKPSTQYFQDNSTLLNIKAGTAWYFDARLWHCGGINHTDKWRHALTMNICHPWMKQYIDIPRLLDGTDTSKMSVKTKQKLGFYSQPPSSYNEYYDSQRPRIFI